MRSNYKPLGRYIREIDIRNTEGKTDTLLGVSVKKQFITSIANTIGTDFTKYKVVKKRQFTYIPDTSRRGDKIAISLLQDYDEGLVSNVYTVFEVEDEVKLLPEYLMLWFSRTEFDRYARYKSHGSVREIFDWDELCRVELPVPPIEKQRNIVAIYKTITDRIDLKKKINNNLEQQAQAIVSHYCNSNPPKIVLKDITTFANGFAFQSASYLTEGVYKIITIKNVQDGKLDSQGSAFINNVPSRMKADCFLHIGDVLLSLTGNVGRVGIVCEENLLLNQRVAKFVPSDKGLLPYLYFYFRLPSGKISLETIAKGTAQQNLSPIETLKLEIPFDETAKKLSISLSSLFKTIILIQRQNQSLSELRDALLPKLMSGEIDVADIDL